MRHAVHTLILTLILCTALSGCSVHHTIHTKSAKAFNKEITAVSKSVKKAKVVFFRPHLTIQLNMSEEPDPQTLDDILTRVKAFATVDNVNEMARSVNWRSEIWEVRLTMNTDDDEKTIEHAYFARYFKTMDHTDLSEENIDAYRTWHKELPPP